MSIKGYFISEDQHLRVCRALDVLCVAIYHQRAENEKRDEEPQSYTISCLDIVHEIIAEIMYNVAENSIERTV